MADNHEKEQGSYTFPELMKRYFPNDEIKSREVAEMILTKEDYLDILMRVNRSEGLIPPDKRNSETLR
jgi:hypothetical protein